MEQPRTGVQPSVDFWGGWASDWLKHKYLFQLGDGSHPMTVNCSLLEDARDLRDRIGTDGFFLRKIAFLSQSLDSELQGRSCRERVEMMNTCTGVRNLRWAN
jgi:hypothetical protein